MKKITWSVIGILTIFLILTTSSLYFQNYWSAETEHSCAGYIYLTTGDMINVATHGIFTGMLSSIPLLFIDIDHPSWNTIPNIKKYCQFEFITYGDNNPELMLVLTKIPMILIGLLGGIYVWKWSKELFNNNASGILSLTLYCFFPLVMGYSKSTSLDITTAVFFFITVYYFWKYYQTYEIKHILLTGLFLGLTVLTKPNVLIIFPLLIFIGLIYAGYDKFKLKKLFWLMIKICAIAGVIFLAVYSFDWNPLYDYNDPLYAGGGARSEERLNEMVKEFPLPTVTKFVLTKIPVPASHYWQGFYALFSYISTGNAGGTSEYFKGYDGDVSNTTKWMWSIVLKTPIALFILFGVSLILMAIKRNKDYLFLFIPLILYLAQFTIVGMVGGVRLLLPAYFFVFVLCGVIMTKRKWYMGLILGPCLIWYIWVALTIYPSFNQYYNEFIGGPENAPKYFINADIDAKEDFKMLKLWMDKNNINHIYLNSSIYSMHRIYNINHTPFYDENRTAIMNGTMNGYFVISISSLYGESYLNKDDFTWLRELEPIPEMQSYGYSLRVFENEKEI